jgi:L-lactate dehydrogenase complex protein LldE
LKVSLLIPCYVDQYFPRVGVSVVELLQRLGHSVDYPQRFTCCGQPPFNAGCHKDARPVARMCMDLYEDADVVVVPSGSCAAMVKVFYPQLFDDEKTKARAETLGKKVWEFSDFLVNHLNITDVGATFHGKATFHDGCHGLRELGVKSQPRKLLERVRGLELIEMDEAQTCCGFGGTFAVKFPEVSTAMAEVKAESIKRTGTDTVISNDPSCLMHIDGYMRKRGINTRCLHLAEVLAGV